MKKTSNPNITVSKSYSNPFSYKKEKYTSKDRERWYIEGYMLYKGIFIQFTIYDNVGFGPKPEIYMFATIGDECYYKRIKKSKEYTERGMRQVCQKYAAEVQQIISESYSK